VCVCLCVCSVCACVGVCALARVYICRYRALSSVYRALFIKMVPNVLHLHATRLTNSAAHVWGYFLSPSLSPCLSLSLSLSCTRIYSCIVPNVLHFHAIRLTNSAAHLWGYRPYVAQFQVCVHGRGGGGPQKLGMIFYCFHMFGRTNPGE